MKRLMRIALPAASASLILGCGGSGSNVSISSLQENTQTLGASKVSYSGTATPLLSTSTYGVSVQGLSGAAFSYIDLYPQPSLLNTMLVYDRGSQVWTYSFLTGTTREVTHFNAGGIGFGDPACWGQNGLLLLSSETSNGPLTSLLAMYPDGTHLTTLSTTGAVFKTRASWDGTKTAGLDRNGNFVVMYANGSNILRLQAAANLDDSFSCTWIGNSTLAFTGAGGKVYTISSAGGSPTLVFGNGGIAQVAGFSDGTQSLIMSAQGSLYALQFGVFDQPLSPDGVVDSSPSIAPDNQTMAFYRHKSGSENDGYSGIWTQKISGDDPVLLIPDPTSSDQLLDTAGNVDWSPFPSYRRFVGTGGSVTTASSGFLLSQLGAGISGFFTFLAKTPSTATITPNQPVAGYAPLVFSVHADAITGLWWKNGFNLPASSTSILSGVTDTVVSFDGTNGQITFVAPAIASKASEPKPRVSMAGVSTICSGKFRAIYDGEGINLAPNGASSIQVDTKTGKLISWK